MESKEGNKLIAEFMGGEKLPLVRVEEYLFTGGHHIIKGSPTLRIHELKYHSSWDWLMPVVDKIISLGWQFQLNAYDNANAATFINGTGSSIKNIYWSTPLLAVYNNVIDFIIWYNKQKSLPTDKTEGKH